MSAQGFSGSEGTDSNALGLPDPPYDGGGRWDADGNDLPAREPERQDRTRDDLGPIYDRMDLLAQQNQALVEAFQQAAAGYDADADGYDDDEYDDEALSPEERAELDELDDEDDGEPSDVFDLIDHSVQRHLGDAAASLSAERAHEEREQAFDDLRDAMPLLQDETVALPIVARAQELANAWDPSLIGRPEFVELIRLVTLAAIGGRATREQSAQQSMQRRIELESASGGGQLSSDRGPSEPDWGARVVQAAERLRARV